MITIVDYGLGNLGSIANMLKKVGAEACISADPEAIARAEKLILPGVGAFDAGMANLEARGLASAIERRVRKDGVPLLGLCLGLQLCTRRSDEGSRKGFGWFDAETVRFTFPAGGMTTPKIPHMGWNRVQIERAHPVFADLPADSRFYFVHSYHIANPDPVTAIATTEHGYRFVCGLAWNNIVGLQFHPEKSHRFGMQVFRNFAAWQP